MNDHINDIRGAISGLNIDVSNGNSDHAGPPPIQWKDITELVDIATHDFDVGQLVHLPNFTLLDAMSAIEIMDPKMDTGMMVAGEPNPVLDVMQSQSPEQVLWIMDRLLTCEMAWISGHSLAQTVYTCIYFHHVPQLIQREPPTGNEPSDIVYEALRAYILASVKCCQYIWREMSSGNVYEEEDCTANLFGLSLYEQYKDSTVLTIVDAALHLLEQLIQRAQETKDAGFSSNQLTPLLNRLYARKSYMLALIYLAEAQCARLNDARRELDHVISLLSDESESAIFKTLGAGKVVEGAFDPNINRKLTSQAPPRPITLQLDDEAYTDYQRVIKQLHSICGVTGYPSIGSLMNYFKFFASQQPYPDAFSRSKLNSIFFHDFLVFGSRSAAHITACAISELMKPPTWILFPQLSEPPSHIPQPWIDELYSAVGTFLERASLHYIDLFKIHCHNRSRQRRILLKVLGEWDLIQMEAESTDEKVQQALNMSPPQHYFSSWAYHVKLELMATVLCLGFELELYGVHEYAMIYLYLRYILVTQDAVIENAIQSTMARGGKKDGMSQKLLNVVAESLTTGVYKLLIATTKKNQLPLIPLRYDSEKERFERRFKQILMISMPEPLSYTVVHNTLQAEGVAVVDLLRSAQQDFDRVKKALDAVSKLPSSATRTEMCVKEFQELLLQLKRICVANNLAIMQLLNAKESDKVKLSFKYHPFWPILEISK